MPCARCKHMKKRCGQDCEFAQHFPAEEHQKFADIHLVFGADNFMNMLKSLPEDNKGDAVQSMAYEAGIRAKDPAHGCFGKIRALQLEVETLKKELADLIAKVERLEAAQSNHSPSPASPSNKRAALPAAHSLPKQMRPSI